MVATNTLSYQLDVLKKTGRFEAFKLKVHPIYSDAAKIIGQYHSIYSGKYFNLEG